MAGASGGSIDQQPARDLWQEGASADYSRASYNGNNLNLKSGWANEDHRNIISYSHRPAMLPAAVADAS